MPPYETNKPIGVILFDVNGDPVDLGGGVGENVTVTNFPSSYPLPDAQVIALTPPAAITGFSTEATLAAVLAKILAAPATEAKQDTGNASLASILAKIIAAPSTEAKQDAIITLITSLNATDFATEATLIDLFNLILSIDFGMDSTLQDILAAIEPSNASTTGSSTNVGDSATNVTLLSANTNRKGGTFYNDSTATLYLKMGATASFSSFTTVVPPRAYFELPFKYTGIVDGIWTSAPGGFCRITELT